MIYLDNAATTLVKPPQVGQAMLAALQTLGNSSRGTHAGALDAAFTVYGARVKLARFFGCTRPDHVVFTANVTEALNIAVNGLIDPGDHVITTALEHNSVLRPLYRAADERGVALDIVPADKRGNIDVADFERFFRPGTKAVFCTHASNLTGGVVDIRQVAEIAHAHGALLIVDAAQTAGAWPVNMAELGADVLCFTGHKAMLGPQGTGGMCLREGLAIKPFKVGGTGVQSYSRTQPQQLPTLLEAGTLNGHGIAGLSAAVDFLTGTGVARIAEREAFLTRLFYEGVKDVPGVTVYGDLSREHTGIVALNIGTYDSGEAADALSEEYGIATRPGAHCAPLIHEALGTKARGAVRFSFSWFTAEEEIAAAVAAVRELAGRNR